MSLNHAHVNLIRKTYTAIGVVFPKAVTKALADFDKITAARIDVPSTEEIADAIAASLLADRDPLADPKVLRFAASRALTNARGESLGYAVDESARRHVLAAIANAADQILSDMQQGAAKPGQQLAAAYLILGDVDLKSSTQILKMGTEATRAWAEASEALALLRTIDSGWHALAELTQFASTTSNPTLRFADLDLDTYEQLWVNGRTDRPADVWAIVQAGGTIDLADRVTFHERVQRIAEARVERQAKAEKVTAEW